MKILLLSLFLFHTSIAQRIPNPTKHSFHGFLKRITGSYGLPGESVILKLFASQGVKPDCDKKAYQTYYIIRDRLEKKTVLTIEEINQGVPDFTNQELKAAFKEFEDAYNALNIEHEECVDWT